MEQDRSYEPEAAGERVALIAVHGVADQKPGETAQSVADQLSKLSNLDPRAARYTPWREEPVRIAVTPVPLAPFVTSRRTGPADRIAPKMAHSEFAREYFDPNEKPDHPALEFMAKKLSGYRGDPGNSSYATVCLRGTREAARRRMGVDIYEMYWADLSRLGGAMWRIIGEFYQLLFHLAILGRFTVDLARAGVARASARRGEYQTWQLLSELHGWASWILSVPTALLNLMLLLLVTVGLPLAVPEDWRPFVATVVYGALCTIAVGWYSFSIGRPWGSAWGVVLGAAVAALIFWQFQSDSPIETAFSPAPALALAWSLAIAGVTLWAARGLNRQVSGAAWVGSLLASAVVVAFNLLLWRSGGGTGDHIVLAVMRVADGLFISLFLLWVVMMSLHLFAWICGTALSFKADQHERRAIRTGRIGIAVPVSLFLVVALTTWAGLKATAVSYLPQVQYKPYAPQISAHPLTPEQYIDRLLAMTAGGGFNVLFLLLLTGMLIMLWAVLPSIIAELKPPDPERSDRSQSMGGWIDAGFVWGAIGAATLVFAVVFWLPAQNAVIERVPWLQDELGGHRMLLVLGSIITATTVGVVAAGHYADVVLRGVRALLDVALDVDQWLREQPNDRTPCARISARYASLLRHVIEWRGADGKGYDRLVIVSHSQGTVITAELLRFVAAGHVEPNHALKALGRELPVRLLTVGSPLRQLYSRRFPHLYVWAGAPDIGALNAEKWTNAYFSGDYVGRHLWRDDDDLHRWTPVPANWKPGTVHEAVYVQADGRTELCLGAGAHTHYFDGTSPVVARLADALVA